MYTKNLTPGETVYGEKIVKINGKEYREWNPYKSKFCACLLKGMKNPIKDGMNILYLGAASGTTVSHLSDINPNGYIYAVEFSADPMKYLIFLAKKRKNIIPIFEDANKADYEFVKKVDFLFQDIAQRNQVEIFNKNWDKYKPKKGLLIIKARSIDVSANPNKVFRNIEKKIKHKIIWASRLEPYEKDHKAYLLS